MDDLLQQGITAYKAGKRDEARNIFITVVKQSPDSQPAWAWLYDVSNNDQERIHCLKQIVRINPNNEKAKQKLDSLTRQDFPFEPPQNIAPPIQAQKNNAMPVAETEKPAVSQKTPIHNQQNANRSTPKNNNKLLKYSIAIIASFCLVCLVIIALAVNSDTSPQNPQQAAVESTPLATQIEMPTEILPPTNIPEPTETPNPNLVAPGTYLVKADIQPGIYKGGAGSGLFSSCYWERLKDLTGSFDAILANDNSVGQFYVEVKNSDYALKTDCELVRLDPIPKHTGEYPQVITTGTYLVGYDIQSGTYKGQVGSEIENSCYWERLQSVAGGFDSILVNDNATGQFYIQVLPSDFALKTACQLEWVSP